MTARAHGEHARDAHATPWGTSVASAKPQRAEREEAHRARLERHLATRLPNGKRAQARKFVARTQLERSPVEQDMAAAKLARRDEPERRGLRRAQGVPLACHGKHKAQLVYLRAIDDNERRPQDMPRTGKRVDVRLALPRNA